MKRPITLNDIERFLRITGMSPSTFGRESVNDPRLVIELRAGMTMGPQREERIHGFMQDYASKQRDLANRLREMMK